jgi:molecular chaperone DnaJ
MAENYYIILGIPADASQEQIKQAYRHRVKQLHPDYYGKNSGPFREIQQAYSVLRDPDRRTAYDIKQQKTVRNRNAPAIVVETVSTKEPPVVPVEPVRRSPVEEVFLSRSFETYSPSIEEISDRLRSNFYPGQHSKSEHIEPLSVEITITPEQAEQGGRVQVMIPVHINCPACRGHGSLDLFVCWRCGGHGVLDTDVPVEISYPAGVPGSHVVQIPLDNLGIRNFYLNVFFRMLLEKQSD